MQTFNEKIIYMAQLEWRPFLKRKIISIKEKLRQNIPKLYNQTKNKYELIDILPEPALNKIREYD